MRTGWRLSKLIDALGAKSNLELDLIPAIQPVLSVGDARGLTAPRRGPRGNAGGAMFAAVGLHGFFKVQAVAAGGAWMRLASLSTATAGTAAFSLFPPGSEPFPSMTTLALTPRQMQGETARSLIFVGNGLTAELPGTAPTFRLPVSDGLTLTSPPWDLDVPQGWWFAMWNTVANITNFCGVVVEDIVVETALR